MFPAGRHEQLRARASRVHRRPFTAGAGRVRWSARKMGRETVRRNRRRWGSPGPGSGESQRRQTGEREGGRYGADDWRLVRKIFVYLRGHRGDIPGIGHGPGPRESFADCGGQNRHTEPMHGPRCASAYCKGSWLILIDNLLDGRTVFVLRVSK